MSKRYAAQTQKTYLKTLLLELDKDIEAAQKANSWGPVKDLRKLHKQTKHELDTILEQEKEKSLESASSEELLNNIVTAMSHLDVYQVKTIFDAILRKYPGLARTPDMEIDEEEINTETD